MNKETNQEGNNDNVAVHDDKKTQKCLKMSLVLNEWVNAQSTDDTQHVYEEYFINNLTS